MQSLLLQAPAERFAGDDPVSEPVDDEGLVLALRAGDRSSLDALMRRHAPAVVDFLFRKLGHRDAAEDLAQDVFLRVFTRASTFRPGNPFRGWLFGIAHNALRDFWRRRQVEDAAGERFRGPSETLPADDVERRETRERVRKALDDVPEPFHTAVVLCDLEGLSYEEAAAAMDCPVKTLSTRLVRGRTHLRDLLSRRMCPEERSV